jgi:hypothetical protein
MSIMKSEAIASSSDLSSGSDPLQNIQETNIPEERVQQTADLSSVHDCYQDTSPAEVCKCVGYGDEPYEYFDGHPGKDGRFTLILREVRQISQFLSNPLYFQVDDPVYEM